MDLIEHPEMVTGVRSRLASVSSLTLPLHFVIQGLGPGGAEKQLLLTARYLSEKGYPCRVFPLARRENHPRIGALVEAAKAAGVEFYYPSRSAVGRQFLQLSSLLRATGPAVLWSWGRRSDLICKLLAILFRDVRLICSLRSAHHQRARKYRLVDQLLSSYVVRYASNSWLSCEHLAENLPGVLPRCRVIYNCLESEEFNEAPVSLPPLPKRLEVVMLGNIAPLTKGYDHVIEVAQKIRAERLPIRISIAGRDHHRNWLQDRIEKLQIHEHLHYAGQADRPYEFLRRGHVFLLMSRLEGTPNALLEAMNIGLPCISTKVGDVARITKDSENIRLVDVGDVEKVVSILKEFLSDWDSAVRLGVAARELCASRFTPERMVADTVEMLRELHPEGLSRSGID